MLSKKEQKYIKSLKVKKYRTREKSFLVEGAKNVQELLKSDFEVEVVVGTEEFFSLNLSTGDNRNEIVKADLLGQLGTFKTNHDALAVARMQSFELEDVTFDDHLFVLDGVGDPGNVGTIIRTLDWFGFSQMICSADSADFYSPKVINSTMGSFTRVKAVETDIEMFLRENSLPVYTAEMEGSNIHQMRFDSPCVFVMGSESHGVNLQIKKYANHQITIPKFGFAESLNVAMATGIIAAHLRIS